MINKIYVSEFENGYEIRKYNLAKLNPIEIENRNNLISSKIICPLSLDLSTNKILGLDNFPNILLKTYWKKFPIIYKMTPKIKRKKYWLILWDQHKLDIKSWKGH